MNYLETLGFIWILGPWLIGTIGIIYACWQTLHTVKRQVLRGAVEELFDTRDAMRMRDGTDMKKLEEDILRRMVEDKRGNDAQ